MASGTRRGRIPLSITAEAWLVVAAVAAAVWMLRSGALASIIAWTSDWSLLSSLVVGSLYSTFITTPLAIGGFIELSKTIPIWQIALTGGLGATIVDILLVDSLRSPLAMFLVRAVAGRDVQSFGRRIARGKLRWMTALLGAFLIAIPLPTDELGVVLFGISHLRPLQLVPLIFAADFVGIYAIALAAQYFS